MRYFACVTYRDTFVIQINLRNFGCESHKRLLAGSLLVLQELVLIVGKGIGMLVERLLVEQLGLEQVAHP